eukprot:gnl/TRDRNA2_/TRDRNA2_177798_c0_seq4.p1 gnl/TRDRNA2_/TRDRNA2_177798_c0~~gnl/TRDRNA2_/TRDRNA2_177798_c0_seq4.p1  ORF type:complete len:218 (+),score=1.80 gnl/TRDRNA2_/TRDRNA2_177798_c0_seq4:762-1415(+)
MTCLTTAYSLVKEKKKNLLAMRSYIATVMKLKTKPNFIPFFEVDEESFDNMNASSQTHNMVYIWFHPSQIAKVLNMAEYYKVTLEPIYFQEENPGRFLLIGKASFELFGLFCLGDYRHTTYVGSNTFDNIWKKIPYSKKIKIDEIFSSLEELFKLRDKTKVMLIPYVYKKPYMVIIEGNLSLLQNLWLKLSEKKVVPLGVDEGKRINLTHYSYVTRL